MWLSLTVDGEVFDEADRPALQPLTDWHIVASAPLVVENTLPISGSYMVWELPEVRSFTYRTLCSRSHLHNPHLGVSARAICSMLELLQCAPAAQTARHTPASEEAHVRMQSSLYSTTLRASSSNIVRRSYLHTCDFLLPGSRRARSWCCARVGKWTAASGCTCTAQTCGAAWRCSSGPTVTSGPKPSPSCSPRYKSVSKANAGSLYVSFWRMGASSVMRLQ